MSWLFVALIPGLLMLATLGLERLENTLNRGCVDAADVAEFLAQAEPRDMRTLARDGMPEALDCLGGAGWVSTRWPIRNFDRLDMLILCSVEGRREYTDRWIDSLAIWWSVDACQMT